MSAAVAFLMYHEIERPQRALCNDDPGYARYVAREADFHAHVARLHADGIKGLAVRDVLSESSTGSGSNNGGGSTTTPRVVITFDDGCETDLIVAAPTLSEAGFHATFYVTVEHLERRGYLSRSQLRELADLGGGGTFEIGSHSMTHRYLHDLPTPEVRDELVGSKKELEDITGQRVASFSCPGGRWDRRVSRAARDAGYDSLVTSAIGMNSARTDRFRLSRIAVVRGMPAAELARVARGEGLLKRHVQSAVLNAAKRVLGNTRYERLRATAFSLVR